MIHRFGECELDEALDELRRAGERVPLEPKVFDVLRHLVRHADRVVTKDELFDAVWPDEVVSESVLHRSIHLARRAIGDPGGRSMLATVRGAPGGRRGGAGRPRRRRQLVAA